MSDAPHEAHDAPRREHEANMTQRSALAVSAAFALVFCSASVTVAAPLELRECRLESDAGGGAASARCGSYVVRENREDPASRELRLHVAVIPALRLQPERDPLFILSGGPGQAATDFYLSMAPAFARIRRDRDIVLVDQRGTGRSHRLDCELPEEGELTAVDLERLRAAVRACLAALPGDPRYYTTSIAVRDLDGVRAALGYDVLSLYGASYGTRVAQHYMRRYPQRVRAAILDGVAPAHVALGPDIALVAQQALDATFARCAADARCNQAFPAIERQFSALRERIRQQPFAGPIPHPVTAQATHATLGEAQLAAAVRLLTYSDETSSVLPLLIHEAQAQRPQALAAQYLMIRDALKEQLAQGMHFAVVCSEDAPRWSQEPVNEKALAATYMGPDFMRAMRAICDLWPRGPVDRDFAEPLRSDAPTLLLSGGADPATPASYAELALAGFSAGRHLELEGQGHGQIGVGCIPRLAAEFIAEGSAKALDAACVELAAPTPFMLSLTSPAP
jgi:pimeloyl-ACP methyl ester carboxylesterase